MANFAFVQPDPDNPTTRRVQRVIVVASAQLAADLTRTNVADWVETKLNDAQERFASPGDEYDPTSRERFRSQPLGRPRRETIRVSDTINASLV